MVGLIHHGDTNASRACVDPMCADKPGALDTYQYVVRHLSSRELVTVVEQDYKFIPTHTGDRVTLACTFGNCICDLLQKPIAKSVSLAVIHWLEEVEVNKQQSRVRTVTA